MFDMALIRHTWLSSSCSDCMLSILACGSEVDERHLWMRGHDGHLVEVTAVLARSSCLVALTGVRHSRAKME